MIHSKIALLQQNRTAEIDFLHRSVILTNFILCQGVNGDINPISVFNVKSRNHTICKHSNRIHNSFCFTDVVPTDKEEVAFKDLDAAILVGSMPRKDGMERKDLLKANVAIFKSQGAALEKYAKKTVKVMTQEFSL